MDDGLGLCERSTGGHSERRIIKRWAVAKRSYGSCISRDDESGSDEKAR